MSQPQRNGYPCDISEAQWKQIDCLLPYEAEVGRKRTTSLREVVNAINYRWHTGCAWRMLPHDFPPWGTIYSYFRRWQRKGTLREIRDVILRKPKRNTSENSSAPQSQRSPTLPRNPHWEPDAQLNTDEPNSIATERPAA